ncbi:HAMP domain-containing sensor histidine kinase [Terracoccus sp. 273MFTsu3.1]|uniref:sensor histidine kinase n=1 Tax=Terracoccus sp. 273MFTsu3.1 TaxID=1172188 RepID=UPI00035C0CD4|nr:HAMP domain-containing sensor histidine kinase [Terracoccus sp. 273MFTsu3.1]
MRRQITWLVAATTSAVVVAFIIPLCLLVSNVAEDRAVNRARQQAHSVATVVASVDSEQVLSEAVGLFTAQGMVVAVHTPSGRVIGRDTSVGDDDAEVAQARSTRTAFTHRTDTGLDVIIPVQTESGVTVVESTVSNDEMRQGVAAAWATIICLGLLLVGVAALIALRLGRRVSVPVTRLAAVAHRIREGEVGTRAVPEGPPETVELAGALNQLADRIDVLVTSERAAVADLGHRLRTPVTALRLDSDLVTDPEVSSRLRHHVDELQRSVDAIVHEARRPLRRAMPSGCDLGVVVRRRAAFWEPLAQDQERAFAVSGPDGPCPVGVPEEDVSDVVDVLLDNVFAHTPEGAGVEVAVRVHEGRAQLTVADGGPGAPQSALDRGRSGSGSTGLGLDIARRVAEAAGGSVALDRSDLGGLLVRVSLPLQPEGGTRHG